MLTAEALRDLGDSLRPLWKICDLENISKIKKITKISSHFIVSKMCLLMALFHCVLQYLQVKWSPKKYPYMCEHCVLNVWKWNDLEMNKSWCNHCGNKKSKRLKIIITRLLFTKYHNSIWSSLRYIILKMACLYCQYILFLPIFRTSEKCI